MAPSRPEAHALTQPLLHIYIRFSLTLALTLPMQLHHLHPFQLEGNPNPTVFRSDHHHHYNRVCSAAWRIASYLTLTLTLTQPGGIASYRGAEMVGKVRLQTLTGVRLQPRVRVRGGGGVFPNHSHRAREMR